MDQGSDFKPFRGTAPRGNPPSCRGPVPPSKDSINNADNSSVPSAPSGRELPETLSSGQNQARQHDIKQEPKDHDFFVRWKLKNPLPNLGFHARKNRNPPAYSEQVNLSNPPYDGPQYFSAPKAYFQNPESYNNASFSVNESHQPLLSSPVSRSRSPSLHLVQDSDVEDVAVFQSMPKRKSEAKTNNSKLTEQRLAIAALESRLSAQTAASEAAEFTLKSRISTLEAREASCRAKAVDARSRMEEAEREAQDATTRLNDIRAAAKTGLDEVKNKLSTVIYQHFGVLTDLKSDYDVSQDAVQCLTSELSELRRMAADAVHGIETSDSVTRSAETRALIDELQRDRDSAHRVIDLLRDKLHLISTQVLEAKERIIELETIREGEIQRIGTKVEELTDRLLQKEEEGARAMAKADALAVRLRETNERLLSVSKTLNEREVEVRGLREQKNALEWELTEKCAKIVSLETLSANLVVLEEQNVALKCQVTELKEKKIALEFQAKADHSKIATLQTLETELIALRAEKVAVECEAKENHRKIVTLEKLHRDASAKLEQSKSQVHKYEMQLVQLQAELTSVEAAKEHFESSLEAAQLSETKLTRTNSELAQETSTLTQQVRALTTEVHASTLREAILKEKEAALQQKSDELAVQVSTLKGDASAQKEELRRVNNEFTVLQNLFDSQALTLKLTKEQSGDLQERLLMSESSYATKLECAIGKLNVELAVLREQKASIQATLHQVTEEVATQRAGLLGASADYENKLTKQEEMYTKLARAEERRAIAAERETAEAKQQVEDLLRRIQSGRAELEDLKRKAQEAASSESMGAEGEVDILRARLEDLQGENSRLQDRAKSLNQRYKDGDLSDSERSFVRFLMRMAQSTHEQDTVAKDTELLRRENMISSLQTRIDTLEKEVHSVSLVALYANFVGCCTIEDSCRIHIQSRSTVAPYCLGPRHTSGEKKDQSATAGGAEIFADCSSSGQDVRRHRRLAHRLGRRHADIQDAWQTLEDADLLDSREAEPPDPTFEICNVSKGDLHGSRGKCAASPEETKTYVVVQR
ncbi:hypothetical protein MVEN_02000100 [Mycena venus]|uniref:Uncharacterized protein n=1 Tax=Mycena venus TaxID=2733690 RepID=A0A8H6XEV2_9AGAR|nr:hypothetical protein MVEN_02000100 [Mycena venus]